MAISLNTPVGTNLIVVNPTSNYAAGEIHKLEEWADQYARETTRIERTRAFRVGDIYSSWFWPDTIIFEVYKEKGGE